MSLAVDRIGICCGAFTQLDLITWKFVFLELLPLIVACFVCVCVCVPENNRSFITESVYFF